MEVILLDSIPKLGERGSTVKVKSGFARNYLFPRRLALPASEANRRVFQENQRVLEKRDQHARAAAEEAAKKFADVSCTIPVQVGEEDRLYGSVTTADVARSLADQGYEVDRKQIQLDEPIKQLGVYTVDIRLHREVSAPIKVWVVKE
jgi:large subunit ribosomal protein L9